MSKGNPLLGQRCGKVGDRVFYRYKGKQRVRAYVADPHNPKTDAQVKRRSKFGSCTLAYHLFKSVITDVLHYDLGQTAWNDFVKSNIDNAPYISKSERETWDKLRCFPNNWLLKGGANILPPIWYTSAADAGVSPRPYDGTNRVLFCTSSYLHKYFANYVLSHNWITPDLPFRFYLTPSQVREMLCGGVGNDVVYMVCGGARLAGSNDCYNTMPPKYFYLSQIPDRYFENEIEVEVTGPNSCEVYQNGAIRFTIDSFTFHIQMEDVIFEGQYVSGFMYIECDGLGDYGFLYSVYTIVKNSFPTITSNITLSVASSTDDASLFQTMQRRKDDTSAESVVALQSWQT